MKQTSEKKFPLNAKDYKLCEEVGEGVSATVHKTLCLPLNETVAVKVLDLEKCKNDLDGIRREVQTMILTDHPNVLQAYCSFNVGHSLWVVMPYMGGGSCQHIMKSAYPEGFEEPVIATVLYEVLKALVYLHAHGHIHRDVKAGNILIDTNGTVRLADFGVAACMFETGNRQHSRTTFVGTPCWMAPEVMQQLPGYDFKADIWSFGITALELAHGHAPFSKYPPMKVLLMTLQNAPPGLDYERDKKFSKSFKEMVAACLVKDPKKRPSSEKLLKHPFFKHARSADYLSRSIIEGLSPLAECFSMLKAKEADRLLQNKSLYGDKEHLSQQEYIRGVSAWNFNMDDLKNQAALIQDDPTSSPNDSSLSWKHTNGQNGVGERIYSDQPSNSDSASVLEGELNDIDDLKNSFAAFPIKPLQALKGCFDVRENDKGAGSSSPRDTVHLAPDQLSQQQTLTSDQELAKHGVKDSCQNGSLSNFVSSDLKKIPSSSVPQDNNLSVRKFVSNGDREQMQPRYQVERNCSGPLQGRPKKDLNYSTPGEEAADGTVIECRGRFKVTSADAIPNDSVNHSNSTSGICTIPQIPNTSAASVLPLLQCLLQLNAMEKEAVLKMLEFVEQASGNASESTGTGVMDMSQMISSSVKERELQAQVIQMQQSIGSLVEEVQRIKAKNSQLEQKLSVKLKNHEAVRE